MYPMVYFVVYLKLFGILFLGVLILEIPLFLFIPKTDQGATPEFPVAFFIFMVAFIIALYYFLLKAYYMVALISLENVKSIKEAWSISNVMTKGNLLSILGFAIVVGLIGQLGIIACGICLLISLPLTYVLQYVSYEDGIQKIKVDELEEIGKISE